MCVLVKKCITFNIVHDDNELCQLTTKRALCLEQEEIFQQDGGRMFYKKVTEDNMLKGTVDSQGKQSFWVSRPKRIFLYGSNPLHPLKNKFFFWLLKPLVLLK